MKLIADLADMIDEELEGAEHYIKCALKHKDMNPSLAKVFFDMSIGEMHHVDMLHGEVVKVITEYKETKGEPPAAMQAVYDYVHEKHISRANKIKGYQNQYRGI